MVQAVWVGGIKPVVHVCVHVCIDWNMSRWWSKLKRVVTALSVSMWLCS